MNFYRKRPIQLTTIASRSISKFFRPNKYPKQPIVEVEQKKTSNLKQFKHSSWAQYNQVGNGHDFDRKLVNSQLNQRHQRPSIGSLIEFRRKINGEDQVEMGVVLADEQYLFKRNYYTVLSLNSEIITVHNDEIRFSLNRFFKLNQLKNHDALIECSKGFIKLSQDQIFRNNHILNVLQAWFAKKYVPQQVDLLNVTELMKDNITEKDINKNALLFGLYLYFQNDPYNYTVVEFTNYLNEMKSDACGEELKIFVNPIYESELLEHSKTLSSYVLNEFNDYLKKFLITKEYSLLDEFFLNPNHEEFIDFQSLISLMKQFIRNPHPLFKKDLEVVFDGVIDELTPSTVHEVLRNLGIYKESTQVLNYVSKSSISLTNHSNKVVDKFKYLRADHDILAFGFPNVKSGDKYSDLAVSLDINTDSNVWELSIHFPDIGSVISKTDSIVESILNKTNDTGFSLFTQETTNDLLFSESNSENKAYTITLQYDLKENKRWNDIKSIDVKLTKLNNLKIVPINELNKIWKFRKPNLESFLSYLFKGDDETSKKLSKSDNDLLNHFFTMIDYWYFKRNDTGSMEYQFPTTTVKLNEETNELIENTDINENYSYLNYIKKEIELIVSNYLFKYSQIYEIPLLVQKQNIINDIEIKDKIQIQSTEFLYPDFETSNFNHLIYNKDENGMTPLQNYIVALQFLKPIETVITTNSDNGEGQFASLGLNGYIKIVNPFNDFESIVNQWQLLNHLHTKFVDSVWAQNELIKYDLDIIYPKNFKILNSNELQTFYDYKVKPMTDYNKFSNLYQRRFLKLLKIQKDQKLQTLVQNWNIYRCVILKSSSLSSCLTKAYCFELDLQIDIEHSTHETFLIGDQIICSEISYIDPYTYQIILKL